MALGRLDEARERIRAVNVKLLGREKFDAHRTQALVHLHAMELELCEAEIHKAHASHMTISEQRDLEFLRAELHRARGDSERALTQFEIGARHTWRWGGGDGLLSWGNLLSELGRHDEARAAWHQCVEQAPQSFAASKVPNHDVSGK